MEEVGPHGAEGAEREGFVRIRGFVLIGHCRKMTATAPVVLKKVVVAPNIQIFIFFCQKKNLFILL